MVPENQQSLNKQEPLMNQQILMNQQHLINHQPLMNQNFTQQVTRQIVNSKKNVIYGEPKIPDFVEKEGL